MARYFLEVRYKGTNYSGFQIQENAATVQFEVEKALLVFYKEPIRLTGSSRTDAGVHARQNFFHCDTEQQMQTLHIYNINAILPADISLRSIRQVNSDAHCRFHAISRTYEYHIYNTKNPFLTNTAWYYPYHVDISLLNLVSACITGEHNFEAFSKRNSQVHTYICNVFQASWAETDEGLVFKIEANRFLRGMVRALTATQLKVGRKLIDIEGFKAIIESHDCKKADFSAPGHGLYLKEVKYPTGIFV